MLTIVIGCPLSAKDQQLCILEVGFIALQSIQITSTQFIMSFVLDLQIKMLHYQLDGVFELLDMVGKISV